VLKIGCVCHSSQLRPDARVVSWLRKSNKRGFVLSRAIPRIHGRLKRVAKSRVTILRSHAKKIMRHMVLCIDDAVMWLSAYVVVRIHVTTIKLSPEATVCLFARSAERSSRQTSQVNQ
jgi:hypothetical protein